MPGAKTRTCSRHLSTPSGAPVGKGRLGSFSASTLSLLQERGKEESGWLWGVVQCQRLGSFSASTLSLLQANGSATGCARMVGCEAVC